MIRNRLKQSGPDILDLILSKKTLQECNRKRHFINLHTIDLLPTAPNIIRHNQITFSNTSPVPFTVAMCSADLAPTQAQLI
jgi:hypothetical protein